MTISSILSSIPRLVIVVITISTYNELVTCEYAAILVRPLWSHWSNCSSSTNNVATADVISFNGSSGEQCALELSLQSPATHFSLEINKPETHKPGESFMFLTNIKRERCPNKYIVFNDVATQCNSIISDPEIRITTQGLVSLSISAVLADETLRDCPESQKDNEESMDTALYDVESSSDNYQRRIFGDSFLSYVDDILEHQPISYFFGIKSPDNDNSHITVDDSYAGIVSSDDNSHFIEDYSYYSAIFSDDDSYLTVDDSYAGIISADESYSIDDGKYYINNLSSNNNHFTDYDSYNTDITSVDDKYYAKDNTHRTIGLYFIEVGDINLIVPCHNVQGYDKKLECSSIYDCDIYFGYERGFDHFCEVTLGYREGTYRCQRNHRTLIQRVLIVYPPQVQTLDFSSNELVEVNINSFQGLTYLRSLDISFNQIVGLDKELFQGLRNLLILTIRRNQIIELNKDLFKGLSNLHSLDIGNNQIIELNKELFQGLSNLHSLNLGSNLLTQLDPDLFEGLTKLRELDLHNNLLKTIKGDDFRTLTNLEFLDISCNELVEVNSNSFHGLTNLHTLYLGNNHIIELQKELFQDLPNLYSLDIGYNQFAELNEELFQGLSTLSELYLSGNELVSCPTSGCHELTNLRSLSLASKGITHLFAGIFQGLSGIGVLDLNSNNLETLPSDILHDLINLRILDLGSNLITELHEELFTPFTSLVYLNLSSNTIVDLPIQVFKSLINLRRLDLTSNLIMKLNENLFQGLTNLVTLNLNQNHLVALPNDIFYDLISITGLILNTNQITQLNVVLFRDLYQLTELDFARNKLSILPREIFHGLVSLQSLELNSNLITQLDPDLFEGLTQLRFLNLRNNSLKSIKGDEFWSLTNLYFLDISYNDIVYLDMRLIRGLGNLNTLYLFNTMIEELIVPDDLEQTAIPRLQFFSLYYKHNNRTVLDFLPMFNRFITFALFVEFGTNEVDLLPRLLTKKKHLSHLKLTNMNDLVMLDSDLFRSLRLSILDISRNGLVGLSKGAFHGLVTLKSLYVHKNQLKMLDKEVFQSLSSVSLIDLTHNLLTHLDSVIFKNTTSLNIVDLSYNRIIEISGKEQLAGAFLLRLYDNPLTFLTENSFSSLALDSEVAATQHEICVCFIPTDRNITCNPSGKRSPYLTCDHLLSDKILVVIMWIIGVNAFFGNLFVLVWRNKGASRRTVNSRLLSNLAISDLLIGVYMLIIACADIYYGDYFPMYSETWRLGATCRFAGALSIMATEASVFFVMLISIDRFISIRFPFSTRKFTEKSVILITILTWTFSFTLGLIPSILTGRNFKFYDNSHVCIGLPLALTKQYKSVWSTIYYSVFGITKSNIEVGWAILEEHKLSFDKQTTEFDYLADGLYFSSTVFLGVNCICYLIVLCCYIEIWRSVKSSGKPAGLPQDEMDEQVKLAMKVTAIVATDFFCWFPIILLGILVQTRAVTLPPSVYAWLVTFVLPINSAINPYLYTIVEVISSYRKKRMENRVIPIALRPLDQNQP